MRLILYRLSGVVLNMVKAEMSKILSVLTVTGMLTACAGMNTKWMHHDIPPDGWRVDAAQCRYDARRKAEKENNRMSEAEVNLYGDEDEVIDTMLTRVGIKKRSRQLFDRCMEDLGYVRTDEVREDVKTRI